MSRTRIYQAWKNMRIRCTDPKAHRYESYGGRGITVCERWQTFENFYADMGDLPEGMTLDRIDPDAGYTPENCRWATPLEQANNKRTTRMVNLNGKHMALRDACRLLNLNYMQTYYRLRRDYGEAPWILQP